MTMHAQHPWICEVVFICLFLKKHSAVQQFLATKSFPSFIWNTHNNMFFFSPPQKHSKWWAAWKAIGGWWGTYFLIKTHCQDVNLLFNPITITIAPLVLPSCSAIRVWTTARHASSDHRRHLPDRSLTSGHLPALRPWNTHTHTQTQTHTHTHTQKLTTKSTRTKDTRTFALKPQTWGI